MNASRIHDACSAGLIIVIILILSIIVIIISIIIVIISLIICLRQIPNLHRTSDPIRHN